MYIMPCGDKGSQVLHNAVVCVACCVQLAAPVMCPNANFHAWLQVLPALLAFTTPSPNSFERCVRTARQLDGVGGFNVVVT